MYKHLLKHNVAKMSEVLSRAQSYIQLEEAMKASSNHSSKPCDGEGESKSLHDAPDHIGGNLFTRSKLWILSPSSLRGDRSMECFTPLKLQINKIFNTIEDQPWVRRPRLL